MPNLWFISIIPFIFIVYRNVYIRFFQQAVVYFYFVYYKKTHSDRHLKCPTYKLSQIIKSIFLHFMNWRMGAAAWMDCFEYWSQNTWSDGLTLNLTQILSFSTLPYYTNWIYMRKEFTTLCNTGVTLWVIFPAYMERQLSDKMFTQCITSIKIKLNVQDRWRNNFSEYTFYEYW